MFSTYLGGSGMEVAHGVAVDTSGNAYIAGETTSVNFPAAAFQTANRGGLDAFVSKIAADGSRLLYSTYLGGVQEDRANAIAVDAAGSAIVTGSTYSYDFPVSNAYQSMLAGGQDAFVTKLAADGRSLTLQHLFRRQRRKPGRGGGRQRDRGGRGGERLHYRRDQLRQFSDPRSGAGDQRRMAGRLRGQTERVGRAGLQHVSGRRESRYRARDCGGLGRERVRRWPDDVGESRGDPGVGEPADGVFDAFVVQLSKAGNVVAGVAYLGGVGADNIAAIAVDSLANIYVAGCTQSPNFTVVNGFQSVNGGNYSAFIGKLSFGTAAAPVSVTVSPSSASLSASQTQQFTATVGNTVNTAVSWSIAPTVGSISSTGLYTAPATVGAQQTVTVTATSVADPGKSASAVER